jgi:hypothetical protein
MTLPAHAEGSFNNAAGFIELYDHGGDNSAARAAIYVQHALRHDFDLATDVTHGII